MAIRETKLNPRHWPMMPNTRLSIIQMIGCPVISIGSLYYSNYTTYPSTPLIVLHTKPSVAFLWKETTWLIQLPALELSEGLLHPLDGGVHLLLHHHPVAGQRGAAALQVLHRALHIGRCRRSHTQMVNGLQLCCAFLTSGHSKRFTILPNIHPSMHTFTHWRRRQTCRARASSSGAVRVRTPRRSASQGVRDQTSNLPVTSQLALPPEPHAAPQSVCSERTVAFTGAALRMEQ